MGKPRLGATPQPHVRDLIGPHPPGLRLKSAARDRAPAAQMWTPTYRGGATGATTPLLDAIMSATLANASGVQCPRLAPQEAGSLPLTLQHEAVSPRVRGSM